MFFTPRVNDLVLAGFLEKGQTVSRNETPKLPTLTARERENHSVAGGRQTAPRKSACPLLNLSAKTV